jgi:putative ABC transport system permease protein
MSIWRRITNVFRADKLNREIDEELQAHMDAALEDGRDAAEARRALGSPLKHRDEAHDARVIIWLDSLRADAVYGWRRLAKNKITTAAAVLSLGLAIGACTAAFRLTDALLWRPLPIAAPHEIHTLSVAGTDLDGKPDVSESASYPMFTVLRDAAKGDADLVAIAIAQTEDLSFAGGEPERTYLQFVSGSMFDSFGLKPKLGRLLNASDDQHPGASPYAVISAEYWQRRFARDPGVVGRTFKFGDRVYEIVGVSEPPFTGTEPGKMVDVFVPITMHPYIKMPLVQFMTVFARVPNGTSTERLGAQLQPVFHSFLEEQLKGRRGIPDSIRERILAETVVVKPAASGSSALQKMNRRPLIVLGVLSLLVLLVACANVANLTTAQAAARDRELALRVSIGGGRRRLVQLVSMEGAWIGALAAVLAAAFAWRAAPFVASMINPPDDPVRLAMLPDWRVFGFLVAATFIVTLLFGFAPALRASKVDPASALKGGENPHAKRRLMYVLIAAQVAFCVAVVFAAGMFVKTFERLSHRPLGFSPERVLTIYAGFPAVQAAQTWDNLVQDLSRQPGIESASMAGWALVDGTNSIPMIVVNGVQSDVRSFELTPGWIETMRVPVLLGRALIASDTTPGQAMVNQEFAKANFPGESAVGKSFARRDRDGADEPFTIVGVVGNTCYDELRNCSKPIVFFPFREALGSPASTRYVSFILRSWASDPAALGPGLRAEIKRVAPSAQIFNIRTQQEILNGRTLQERLLSTLATFFAAVALVLAGVGLYGVLAYSVIQRRREIGIRIAVGAQPAHIARTVIVTAYAMVVVGAVVGLVAGAIAVRPLQSIFYEVHTTDIGTLALPTALILEAAILAALPAVIRAVRIDPVILLRAE